MSGDHDKYHMKVEVVKDEQTELTVLGKDGVRRSYAQHFLIPDDVRRNPEHARIAIEMQEDYIMILKSRMRDAVEALEEAVYLLNPTDEDMQKKAGVYRVVTALEKLKEKNT